MPIDSMQHDLLNVFVRTFVTRCANLGLLSTTIAMDYGDAALGEPSESADPRIDTPHEIMLRSRRNLNWRFLRFSALFQRRSSPISNAINHLRKLNDIGPTFAATADQGAHNACSGPTRSA